MLRCLFLANDQAQPARAGTEQRITNSADARARLERLVMPIKTVTDLRTLMMLAKELGNAKKSGDENRIAEAQKAHDEYRDMCLASDEMQTGMTYGSLYSA